MESTLEPANRPLALVPEGVEERFFEFDGHRMRYLIAGSGPPLLLLHGLLGFSFSYTANLPGLSRHFTVCAPDMLNLGYSSRANVDCSLQATAQTMWKLMDHLGFDRVTAGGTSHGGAVAMWMAIEQPQRMRELVLIDAANPYSERNRWQIFFFGNPIALWIGEYLHHGPVWLKRLFYTPLYADPEKTATPERYRIYLEALEIKGTITHSVRIARCWYSDFKKLRLRLPEIAHIPALLVWGEKDRVVPIASARELQKHFHQAELVVVPGAAHMVYEEQPQEFNRILIDRLGGG